MFPVLESNSRPARIAITWSCGAKYFPTPWAWRGLFVMPTTIATDRTSSLPCQCMEFFLFARCMSRRDDAYPTQFSYSTGLRTRWRSPYRSFIILDLTGSQALQKPLTEIAQIPNRDGKLMELATLHNLEHFPLMLIHSLRGGRNWRILVDKLYEGANEFCARGPVSFAQPLFAAVL